MYMSEYLVCTHMASPQADFDGVDEGLNWGADTYGKLATVKFTAVTKKCATGDGHANWKSTGVSLAFLNYLLNCLSAVWSAPILELKAKEQRDKGSIPVVTVLL